MDQGCALAEPGGPWRLTFALGRLENLRFFIQIICWAPWILQFQSTGPPSIFLRAQPCGFFGLSKTSYFGYMIQSISLLRIQKERTMPVVARNNNSFTTYISCLTTLLILTGHFHPKAWIKWSICQGGKIAIQQGLYCSSSQGQNCYTTSPLRQDPWANRPEYNETSVNLQSCQQLCYSFSAILLILWVVSMEMN